MRFPGQEEIKTGGHSRCRDHQGGVISNKTVIVKVESKKLKCLVGMFWNICRNVCNNPKQGYCSNIYLNEEKSGFRSN